MPKLIIEFCTGCGYYSYFKDLEKEINSNFTELDVEGNPTGNGRRGSFEVSIAENSLWSRLNGDGFPKKGVMVEKLKKLGYK